MRSRFPRPRTGATRAWLVALLAAMSLLASACGGGTGDAAAASSDDEMSDDEMSDDGGDMEDDDMSDDMEDEMDDDMSDDMEDDMEEGGAHRFRVTLTNISDGFLFAAAGAQPVPFDAAEAGPAFPGSGYEFVVPRSATSLTFATMFVQSNDWFWAPEPSGLALLDVDGSPRSGDVTDEIILWDAGTEIDQTPGEGPDQAPRQSGPNTGAADADPTVRRVSGFDAADYLAVSLNPNDDGTTTVRVENVSGGAAVPGPIAPVFWAVHGDASSVFTEGAAAPVGLESLAEDGDPSTLLSAGESLVGTTTPFAPVAFWVSEDDVNLVDAATTAGLEMLAEDGSPAGLVAEWQEREPTVVGAATNPDGGTEAGPAFPGSSYSFEFSAHPEDVLTLASMFVQSNDWFVALDDFELYDVDGVPVTGDITDALGLYDAGTEADQAPGAGPDQAPRQAGPNTGATDPDDRLRPVDIDLGGHLVVTLELVG